MTATPEIEVPAPPVYDAAFFHARFLAIPEEQWCAYSYTDAQGRHDALGHLGVTNDENTGLGNILRTLLPNIPGINDGYYNTEPTPKQRVLAALRALIPVISVLP